MFIRYIKAPPTRFALICIMALISSLGIFTQPAYACSLTETPPGGPTSTPDTLQGRIQQTPIIFEGTVIGISEHRQLTTVQVTRYFKGEGPIVVTVLGFGDGPDCLPRTDIGQHGVFYTVGDPNRQLVLQPWSGIEFLTEAKMKAVIDIVGHAPMFPPEEPVQTPESTLPESLPSQSLPPGFIILLGLGLIIAILGLVIWRKRK